MANFVVVVDPDPVRRTEFLRKATASLAIVPTLQLGRCGAGDFAAAWAASAGAPVSTLANTESAAVVWGRATRTGGQAVSAEFLRDAWRGVDARGLEPFDGFYAAVRFDARDGLVGGADLLGFFPLYHWTSGDVVLVASSIASFRAHPLFRAELNPVGAMGVLLTGGLVDGETLWRGVRRLSPGFVFSWSKAAGAREVRQYAFPAEESLANRSFEEQVALLDEQLDDTVSRHVEPDADNLILLSGGRDSRVVAGLLHRRHLTAHTVTFGEPRDYEVECAAAVAKTLGFAHTVAPDPVEDVRERVRTHVCVEQLANGLANFYTWGNGPSIEPWTRALSGYRLEGFIGGTARGVPGSAADGSASARVTRKSSAFGLGAERLRRLARPDVFGTAVDECLERLHSRFAASAGDDDHRAWQADIERHGRFHSGSTPWRLSFFSWPVMLPLDQRLVKLSSALPLTSVAQRRAQDELLRSRFPALARLPLDRNSFETEPLLPSPAWRIRRSVVNAVPLAGRVARQLQASSGERRRYYRLYDINSPMWQTVRELAESGRRRAADLFDVNELASLLPPPNATIALRDPITDSNGLKALLGLLIWWDEHG